jgi:hypothetical protein
VIARLPAIRAMGFDVVYLPPIHPIGRTNRKGRDNSPHAEPNDPGSPYAIGSAEGSHDAIHPSLGTLDPCSPPNIGHAAAQMLIGRQRVGIAPATGDRAPIRCALVRTLNPRGGKRERSIPIDGRVAVSGQMFDEIPMLIARLRASVKRPRIKCDGQKNKARLDEDETQVPAPASRATHSLGCHPVEGRLLSWMLNNRQLRSLAPEPRKSVESAFTRSSHTWLHVLSRSTGRDTVGEMPVDRYRLWRGRRCSGAGSGTARVRGCSP